ncbi:MAG: TetR/AcrR family transcriptional regulator [Bifidobacteriaceae bacterium]|jgi:AcrR family transcriptional regulator|nr:TetR/AcrR family transcriptional regulator [Bifidobacteriaceae bacterium]
MAKSTVNQNDPRVKRTQRLIEQSFWTLMKSSGFDAVSIAQVTKRAGINRATFYAHYADKHRVLARIAARAFRGGIAAEISEAGAFDENVCRHLVDATYDFVFSFYDVCGFDAPADAALIDDEVRSVLSDVVRGIVHDDNVSPVASSEETTRADMISAAIYSAVFGCYARGEHPEVEVLEDRVVAFVM